MISARTMQVNDYSQVFSLWRSSGEMLLRDADSQQSITNYLMRNPNLSFVLTDETNQTIIGAILVGTDGRRGYVQHLAVDTQYRGQGLGKRLLSLANQALSEIGIEKTHLFVNEQNRNAQQFYAKLGWQRREEVRMYSLNLSSNDNA